MTQVDTNTTARLYGKYPGIVADHQDPEKRFRLKVKVPMLFGQEILEEWALPCLPPRWMDVDFTPIIPEPKEWEVVPKKGQPVWVEFMGGDENRPIWTGTWKTK